MEDISSLCNSLLSLVAVKIKKEAISTNLFKYIDILCRPVTSSALITRLPFSFSFPKSLFSLMLKSQKRWRLMLKSKFNRKLVCLKLKNRKKRLKNR